MATPPRPQFDRSLVTESPSDRREEPTDESEADFQDSPTNFSAPAQQAPASWAGVEQPPASTVHAGPGAEFTAGGWQESAAAQAIDAAPLAAKPVGYDWEETAEAPREDTGLDLAESSPFFLGRRPLYKRSELPPTADEQLASVITFLERLRTTIQKVEPAAEPLPSALGSSLLQSKRLSRTGVVPDHFEIGVLPKPPRPEAAPPSGTDSGSVAERKAAPDKIAPAPEPIRRLERRHVVWLVLTSGLCLVTLGLVVYLWTQVIPFPRDDDAPPKPGARGTSLTRRAEVSEEALGLANLALEAMQQGDFHRASDLLTTAQKQGVTLPGLHYQAALVAFDLGDSQWGHECLDRSIAANDAVPDCCYLRANVNFFTGGPAQAAETFEQAVAAAPFSPRYYFFRAECLRRNGNATAAIEQFEQALRCRPSTTDTELILFKIGLTKLETNTDITFKNELRDRLAQETVPGDTLLLAAADAIGRNEFSDAADFLKRAALDLPPRMFQARIRDYVFQAQAKQPDIARVLKLTLPSAAPGQPSTPRTMPVLVDPATRSMAEADPAGW